MGEFCRLGVTRSARRVANDRDVFSGSLDLLSRRSSTSLNDRIVGMKCSATGRRRVSHRLGNVTPNKHHILDLRSHSLGLHAEDFFYVLVRGEDSGHLSLVEDEFDLLLAHGVIETNYCDFVMHTGELGLKPLTSVQEPDSDEAPHTVLGLNFRAELQAHHT